MTSRMLIAYLFIIECSSVENFLILLFCFKILINFFVLVSLDGTTENCAVTNYPANNSNPAAMTYNNGAVLACGGNYLKDADHCWRFNGSTWSQLPNSNQKHCQYDSPNVIVDEGWWVTGTLQTEDYYCTDSSTGEIFTGQNWIPGPTLPGVDHPKGSCVVNLNSTHTMVIGGDPARKDAWLYGWSTKEWTRTGSLIQGRWAHGCVNLGDQGVLVAGGYKGSKVDGCEVYTAELYNPTQGTWSNQPDLPQDIMPLFPILLNYDNVVLALFNQNDQIFTCSMGNGEWSVLKGVQLPNNVNVRGGYWDDKAAIVPETWSCNPAQ